MARLKSPEQTALEEAMRAIRSSSNYIGSLDNVIKVLKLPDSTLSFEMEALLIYATREQFGENLDADMVLMALGLLKGFANPRNPSEDRSGTELITERRRMFIEESSYVADRHNCTNKRRTRHYESCEALKAAGENAIKAVISALGSEDGANIDKVAQKLHDNRRIINDYLAKSKQYLIYDKNKKIIDTKLQDLKCIRQEANDIPIKPAISGIELLEDGIDHPAITGIQQDEPARALSEENTANDNDAISEGDIESDRTGGKDTPKSKDGKGGKITSPGQDPPNPYLTIIKELLGIVAFLILMLVVAVAVLVIDKTIPRQENSAEKVLPDTIEIKNKKITLPPGGDTYLNIEVKPSNITKEQLAYRSTNDEIVFPESLHSSHIIAGYPKEGDEYVASIMVAGDSNAAACDTATITVGGPGSDYSGMGANADDSQDGTKEMMD